MRGKINNSWLVGEGMESGMLGRGVLSEDKDRPTGVGETEMFL